MANENMRGDVQSTIAHEIAHARLGHTTWGPQAPGAPVFADERAADDLIVQWGFTRRYTKKKLRIE